MRAQHNSFVSVGGHDSIIRRPADTGRVGDRGAAHPAADGTIESVTESTFVLPLWADLAAVGLGSAQGAAFAHGFQGKNRLDLLGVALIGIMIGMGGGLIRDILLGLPPATLQSNLYLVVAIAAALVGMLLAGVFHKLNKLIILADAVLIGLFGALGVSKALALGTPVVPAIAIGVAAAVGGGVARDIALGLPVAIMHVGSLYALAAAGGCGVIAVGFQFGVHPYICAAAGILVCTAIRMLSVIFDLSLPEQRRLYRRRVAAEVAVETGSIAIITPDMAAGAVENDDPRGSA